jgi:mannosyltransferase OCH1-like enzyme
MTHPRWKVWDLEDNFWYQELQERNELLLRKMQQQVGTLSPKIPRKIHQIWLGALDQLPSACQKWIETWIAKHPSWEYVS